MTNEQKLRKHIREMIIEALKEGDPYGRPDEDKYLFKTDQDYLAGIQGESVEEPSAEELAQLEQQAAAGCGCGGETTEQSSNCGSGCNCG